MVVESPHPVETQTDLPVSKVETMPTSVSNEGLHFIPLTSTHELARLSASRQDTDYTDTALIAVEGVQMPVCAVRTLLDSESIGNLRTLSTNLTEALGYDPNLQIVIAGPQLQYQGAEKPIMYPAHVMTSFEMEPEVAEGQKTRVTVLGPVCVSIAHHIMLDGRYPFPARVRATEALLEDLRSAANGRYTYIAMPERNGPPRESTIVSLLDGTDLTIGGSPTHALMTHLADQAEPLTVQVDRGEKGNKPYTLYPLPPIHATSLGQDALGKAEMQQKIQEVSAAIMQAWEKNFDRHEKGSDEGLGGVIGQEVARLMERFKDTNYLALLVKMDEDDRRWYMYYLIALEELVDRLPQNIASQIASLAQSMMDELSVSVNVAQISESDIYRISRIPSRIVSTVHAYLRNYQASEPEQHGLHMAYYTGKGLVEGSVEETIRGYAVADQRIAWEFLYDHPELPVCCQAIIDAIHSDQAMDQSRNPLYADYKALKAWFYELFVNMNKDVPTTDSQVDIARTASIIQSMHAEGKMLKKAAVAGSGDMSRFEGPLFILLRKLGITFEEIVAVDRVNYGVQIAASHPELNVDFHQGDILDADAFGGKKVNVLLYPWSVFSDILPRKDSVQALHTAAGLMEPGGILIIDQAIPIGESSYKRMEEEQAPMTGELGVFQRSFAGPDGQELWSTFNIMNMETLLRDAAQAGFIPRNVGPTAHEQRILIEKIESDESVLVREAETGENHDAMKHPIYQANGWNRMTLALEYVGQEEALLRAKAAPSLFHTLSVAVGEAKDGA